MHTLRGQDQYLETRRAPALRAWFKNPKSFCCYVNSSLKGRSNIDAIQCLDGSLASSDQEKAELLNSYISSVFTHENLTNIPILESKDDTPQLDDMAISLSMVCSVITKLKSEKSTGPNSWPIEVTNHSRFPYYCPSLIF